MSGRVRGWLLLPMAAAGCGGSGDACAPYPGQTCVALLVNPPAGATMTVDQVALKATSGFTLDARSPEPAGNPVALPVTVAILPGNGFTGGAFALDVGGLRTGARVGTGAVSGSANLGQHTEITVVLSPVPCGSNNQPCCPGSLCPTSPRKTCGVDNLCG
jgi:hypothetical protein